MAYENGIPDFNAWLTIALLWLSVIIAAGILIGITFGFLVSAAKHGPTEGFYRLTKVLFSAVTNDLPGFSLRRTFAIAWLMIQESIRKRVVLAVLITFAVLLLGGGWFVGAGADNPAKVYLSFVLGISQLLTVVMSIFLATLSLPADMKNKTIYTVVTKPVRSSEIVLGRVLGFAAIGTVVLLLMAVPSYFFVIRGVAHTHIVQAESVTNVYGSGKDPIAQKGVVSKANDHLHTFEIKADANEAETTLEQGHRHRVKRIPDDTPNDKSDDKFEIGPPLEQLQARVPIYGKLNWRDQQGKEGAGAQAGVSVGQEWSYRRYIAGGSPAQAIYTFENITRENFPPEIYKDGIPLELTIRVFRTYKGDIEKNVLGSISLRNPNLASNKRSAPFYKRIKEFETDTFTIPFKVARLPDETSVNTTGREQRVVGDYDLFDDLCDNGRLDVIIKCEDPSQYYGVAQADVYIRAANRPFYLNYIKCFASIWLQMIIVVSFGVFFSTFLSGPVAFIGTISTLVVGFFIHFIQEVVYGMFNKQDDLAYKGGGPIESMIRIVTQQNIQTDLEANPTVTFVIQTIDKGFAVLLYATTFVVPNFNDFDTSKYLALGYNIDAVVLFTLILKALAYTIGTTIIAYFILKTREVAST